jgi:hypothetical protein
MSETTTENWPEANQRYLTARLHTVRGALERHAALSTPRTTNNEAVLDESKTDVHESVFATSAEAPSEIEHAENEEAPWALDRLTQLFRLSVFEQNLLLLCAGMEFDARFSSLCARAQGTANCNYPTLGLALAALPEAYWDALTPTAALRRWRLIEIAHSGETLLQSQLSIDERVLHYLAGISYLDQRLEGLVRPFAVRHDLAPSQEGVADRIADYWSQRRGSNEWPVVLLCGRDRDAKLSVAARASSIFGLRLHVMRAVDVPHAVLEREAFARLWEREALLLSSALVIEQDQQEMPADAISLIEELNSVLFVSVPETLSLRGRHAYRVDVQKPGSAEQTSLWINALGGEANQLNGELERLTSQFCLSSEAISEASRLANEGSEGRGADSRALWDACRSLSRPRLDDLAQRLVPAATWSDLVLPDQQLRALREVAMHVSRRARVYLDWGFASKGERGLGISALFAGSSGTGKTMAAEVLANDLRLDLYRIDLSQLVSKYIGETEKNLRRVFDAAEDGGAILLFDEADALFGKRSEVKDSHDRYANIEVSYLLQRMEAYRGLAILTTNLKNAVDTAFLRRLRFIIQFPFPDTTHRAEIWRRIFPEATPTAGLDVSRLSRLSIAGGNIRNIALHAAFLAADSGEAVTMAHLAQAARGEYAKLEKPLTEAEFGGWF